MDHKAFIFDFAAFQDELKPILEEELASNSYVRLREFVLINRKLLRDPYGGLPLTENWEIQISPKDPHQYGDFAITKYYDPTMDIGLGNEWEEPQELFITLGLSESPILGRTIGPHENPFDPGKMGSYFQSNQQVLDNLRLLDDLAGQRPTQILNAAREVLYSAARVGAGVYVTF